MSTLDKDGFTALHWACYKGINTLSTHTYISLIGVASYGTLGHVPSPPPQPPSTSKWLFSSGYFRATPTLTLDSIYTSMWPPTQKESALSLFIDLYCVGWGVKLYSIQSTVYCMNFRVFLSVTLKLLLLVSCPSLHQILATSLIWLFSVIIGDKYEKKCQRWRGGMHAGSQSVNSYSEVRWVYSDRLMIQVCRPSVWSTDEICWWQHTQ